MSKKIHQGIEEANPFGDLIGLTFASIEIVPTVGYSDGQVNMV